MASGTRRAVTSVSSSVSHSAGDKSSWPLPGVRPALPAASPSAASASDAPFAAVSACSSAGSLSQAETAGSGGWELAAASLASDAAPSLGGSSPSCRAAGGRRVRPCVCCRSAAPRKAHRERLRTAEAACTTARRVPEQRTTPRLAGLADAAAGRSCAQAGQRGVSCGPAAARERRAARGVALARSIAPLCAQRSAPARAASAGQRHGRRQIRSERDLRFPPPRGCKKRTLPQGGRRGWPAGGPAWHSLRLPSR